MKVVDPGHEYELDRLDGEGVEPLRFVKRIGAKYPGNEPPAHPGTTLQEVLRACYKRLAYVYDQRPCVESAAASVHVGRAIHELERRAARIHGRPAPSYDDAITGVGKCPACGHVGCPGSCREPVKE